MDYGYDIIETKLPALFAFMTPSDFVPTNPPFSAIMKAKKKPYEEWTAQEIDADPDQLGLNGSPTQVSRVFAPPRHDKGIIFEGTVEETVKQLADALQKENLI